MPADDFQDEQAETLHQRWSQRWSTDKTAWHQKGVHSALLNYLPGLLENLENTNKLRVLVPLCGKTVDMTYFVTDLSASIVVGVEGVQKGIDEFIAENPLLQIAPICTTEAASRVNERNDDLNNHENFLPRFSTFVGTNIELLKGDFFDLVASDISTMAEGKFDLIWDRGSMVAIQPVLRESYIKVLSQLICPGGKILLCALDRRSGTEEAKRIGPPYSLNEASIRALYEQESWVDTVTFLGEKNEMVDPVDLQKWQEQGLLEMFETYFVIQAKH